MMSLVRRALRAQRSRSIAALTVSIAASCAAKEDRASFLDDGPGAADGSAPPLIGGDPGTLTPTCNPCEDFPAAPIFADGAPSNAAEIFGATAASAAGPCVLEPEPGTLFPSNWLRPRFRVAPAGGETLFELRLHADAQAHDLVVYTTKTTWTMPAAMWTALAAHTVGKPITTTVRGAGSASSPTQATEGSFTIAPAPAEGSMVFWATTAFDQNAQNTKLQGFHVGDEGVVEALATTQVQQKVRATWGKSLSELSTQVQCIGCHTSTPDGKYAAFTAQWPWPNVIASVEAKTVGSTPDFLTPGAMSAMSPNKTGAYSEPEVEKVMLGVQTYSKAHWTPGDRVAVSTRGSAWHRSTDPNDKGSPTGVVAELVWFDLEAPSDAQGVAWDVIARGGDPRSAAAPSWSHDGAKIAYASTDTGAQAGRRGRGVSDVAIVPYGARKGGPAQKLAGASEGAFEEYYPAFSADDALVAFNRVPSGMTMYNQPAAEVYVVPASGGTAVRLEANDPVACSGRKSPGVQNTWPKWAPVAKRASDGKTYHWLVFSSTRGGDHAQLYMTAVVQDGAGIVTYPAIYLWNQSPASHNLVPAWDVFAIPPVPIK
jgi:hypothetical protein